MRRIVILMLGVFIMSCFAIASAHSSDYQQTAPTVKMLNSGDAPPPPDEKPHYGKQHKPEPDNPLPPPSAEQPRP